MRISVEVNGKWVPVDVDRTPTDADVEEIAASLRAKAPATRPVALRNPGDPKNTGTIKMREEPAGLGDILGQSATKAAPSRPAVPQAPGLMDYFRTGADILTGGLGQQADEYRDTAEKATGVVAKGIAKKLPTGGLLSKKADAILAASPDQMDHVLRQTLRNLDPTQMPGFINQLLKKGGIQDIKGSYKSLAQRIGQGDTTAMEELAGMITAGVASLGVGEGVSALKGLGNGRVVGLRRSGYAPPEDVPNTMLTRAVDRVTTKKAARETDAVGRQLRYETPEETMQGVRGALRGMQQVEEGLPPVINPQAILSTLAKASPIVAEAVNAAVEANKGNKWVEHFAEMERKAKAANEAVPDEVKGLAQSAATETPQAPPKMTAPGETRPLPTEPIPSPPHLEAMPPDGVPEAIPPNPPRVGAEGPKYAASNAAANDMLARQGKPPVEPTPQGLAQAAEVYDRGTHYARLKNAYDRVKAGERADPLPEHLNEHTAKLFADQDAELRDISAKEQQAIETGQDPTPYRLRRQSLEDEIHVTTQGNQYVGNAQSRALSSRNNSLRDDYTEAGEYRVRTLDAGRRLTDEEANQARSAGKTYEGLKRRVEQLETQKQAQAAKEGLDALKTGSSRSPKAAKEAIQARRVAAIERAKEKWRQNAPPPGLMADPFGAQIIAGKARQLASIAPEVVEIVGTLAQEGIHELGQVVKQVREHLPFLEDGDVERVIAGEYEKEKGARTQTPMQALKKQAAESEPVRKIREERAREKQAVQDAERAAAKAQRDAKTAQQRAKARQKRLDAQEARRKYNKSEAQRKKAEADAIREARKEGRRQQAEARADYRQWWRESVPGQAERMYERTQTLNEQAETGVFPTRKKAPALDKQLEQARIDLEAAKVKAEEVRESLKKQREWQEMTPEERRKATALDAVAAAPRALKASTDLSFALNQGAFYMMTHPVTSASAVGKGMRALFTRNPEARAAQLLGEIRTNPYYDTARAAGLEIQAHDLSQGDEMLVSGLLGKPLQVGGFDINPISASGRAYVANANALRMNMFAQIAKGLDAPWMKRFGAQPLTLEDYRAIAEYVNTATGVGTGKAAAGLKQFNNAVPVAFAPGYMISRWKLAFGSPLFNATIRSNPRLAAYILKDYLTFAAVAGGSLYAASLAGASVDFDPRSSKFGKIRKGNVEVDPFGGILSPLRVVAQLGAGTTKEGRDRDPNWGQTVGYYATGKASPTLGLAMKAAQKKAYGNNYDVHTPQGLRNLASDLFVPISVGNQFDIGEAKGLTPEQIAVLRIATIFGANVNVNDQSAPNVRR